MLHEHAGITEVNRGTPMAGLLGVLIVAAMVGGGFYFAKSSHLVLQGEILKVRSYSIDQDYTVAVIDFRVNNPSNTQFVVKDVDVTLETKDGKTLDGSVFSEIDARRLFDYYKVLGTKFNPTLIVQDKLNGGSTADKMLAVRFTATDADIQNRKGLRITIHDVDGAVSSIDSSRR